MARTFYNFFTASLFSKGEVSLQDFSPSLEKRGKGSFVGGMRGIMSVISGTGH
jgi:hypothetical protein